jgi:C4-dicarboxylate transporter DctM subunit
VGTPVHPLRKIDDAIFTAERSIVALLLVAMTVTVFLDVVYRQLVTPEGKISQWLAIGIADPNLRATLAPIVGAVIGILVLGAGFTTSERRRGGPILPVRGSAWILAALTAAALALVGRLMVDSTSGVVYQVLAAVAWGAYALAQQRRRPPLWGWRVAGAGVLAALTVALAGSDVFPEGYTWSKELAMTVTLWVGFFGASLCVHEGKHVRLEALEKTQPAAARRWLAGAAHLISSLFCALLAYLGWRYVFAPETGAFYIGGNLPLSGLPLWLRTGVIPFLFGLSALRFLGAAVSSFAGGTYGAPAKAEGMAEAEKLAREPTAPSEGTAKSELRRTKRPVAFFVVLALIALLPLLGPGGILAAAVLGAMLLGEPLFVVLGIVTLLCFTLWGGRTELSQFSILIERIVSIADNDALLAIPLFILSGAVMARGQMSERLIGFARALVGWMPGGMAISAVLACMIFAAISGSSPATVVAIGGMMGPALLQRGYRDAFAHGLVTSAGSLGILIPPSIPMIVYAIVNTTTVMRVEELFASGIGPGLVIGGLLMGYSMLRGIVDRTPRDPFSFAALKVALREGSWSLMFPGLILGGIYSGVFTAVESACVSVVYAILVEVFVHRALTIRQLPAIFSETAIMLGSFLVILVVAMSFVEFLEDQDIPRAAGAWIRAQHLDRVTFLLVVNVLLLAAGCLMDIMSAIFVFVPLLAPMANALGIDPLHLGIIFIVNLEIGYLTPPVGLNLFVASTLFSKPLGYVVRAVLPFIAMMMVGLALITYVPAISVGLGRWIAGSPPLSVPQTLGGEIEDEAGGTLRPDQPARPACEPPEDLDCDGVVSIEEITAYAEQELERERRTAEHREQQPDDNTGPDGEPPDEGPALPDPPARGPPAP